MDDCELGGVIGVVSGQRRKINMKIKILFAALLLGIISEIMACGGLFLGINHQSKLDTASDYGHTTIGAGYSKEIYKFEFSGMLSTPAFKQDKHSASGREWDDGDVMGSAQIRLFW